MSPWHSYWWNSIISLGLPLCHKTEMMKRQLPKRHHGAFVTVANWQGNQPQSLKNFMQKKCWNQSCQKNWFIWHPFLSALTGQPLQSTLATQIDQIYNSFRWQDMLAKIYQYWRPKYKYKYWRPKFVNHRDGRKATNIQKLSISWKDDLYFHML